MSDLDAANVLAFAPKSDKGSPEPAGVGQIGSSDRDVIMQTLENVMDVQERLEKGMNLVVEVITQLQLRVRDLEHAIVEIRKPKRPVILNSTGARAN